MSTKYVDSDGHVMIKERELNEFIEKPFTAWGMYDQESDDAQPR